MHNCEPINLGLFPVNLDEMLMYVYLPIKMDGSNSIHLPKRLSNLSSMVDFCRDNFTEDFGSDLYKYVYLTVKRLYVTPSYIGGRDGWHIDGFGTDDINYIWSDVLETEFCVQDFRLSDDCNLSMKQMEQQAREESVRTFGQGNLLRLDNRQVHRCPKAPKTMLRTFVKVSFSKDKYNLKGNSHNYLIDYDWDMHDRQEQRNHTSYLKGLQ